MVLILHPVLEGRNCADNPLDFSGNASRCCIPCPVSDWVNSSDFDNMANGAAWVNVAGFILCGFLLISYAALPSTTTRRSFLNIVLLIGIMLLELSYIIPLARQLEECHDPVTPNDMHSSLTCAFSGGLAAFGGVVTACWIVVRSLFMHLQICWNITPSKFYFIAANIGVWSVSIGLTSAVLANVGVSFRFGAYCHINVGSIPTYWGPLLGFGVIAALLQLATFIYCAKIYLTATLLGRQDTSPVGRDSKSASVTTASTKRQAWNTVRRVKQVLVLQWRSLAIVTVAIFTIAFVCIIFTIVISRYTNSVVANPGKAIPWLICILQQRNRDECLDQAAAFSLPEPTVVATLFIISFIGIEAFFLLFKFEILKAWVDLIKTRFQKRRNSTSTEGDTDWEERPPRFRIDRGSTVAVESPEGAETENTLSWRPSIDIGPHPRRESRMEKNEHHV